MAGLFIRSYFNDEKEIPYEDQLVDPDLDADLIAENITET